jgi:predicted dehydrogenase
MSDTVRWGFLGAGNIARSALGPAAAAARNARLQAVGARDEQRARRLADDFGGAAAYGSYEEVLAAPDVDAVYISLSNDNHKPWVLAALAAGKHVLCEKPLGMTAAEVEEMVAAAAAADRLLMEAFWYRWHPRTQAAELLVADGAIGTVTHVDSVFAMNGVDPDNYRWDPARGGGGLYDVGCYPISTAVWAYGGEEPQAIDARVVDGPTGVDILTETNLTFSGDRTARVASGMDEPHRQTIDITGTAGSISFGWPAFAATKEWPTELTVVTPDGEQRIDFPPADPYQLMLEAMSDAIAGRPAWLLPLSQSLTIARIIDATFAARQAS